MANGEFERSREFQEFKKRQEELRKQRGGQPPIGPAHQKFASETKASLEAAKKGFRERTQSEKSRALLDEQFQKLVAGQKGEFEQARRGFQRGLGVQLGRGLETAGRAFTQAAGRRGLAFSGVEQAGLQAVQARGQAQLAATLGELEGKFAAAQQQERAAFRAGEFNFLTGMLRLSVEQDFAREMMEFQARMAADQGAMGIFGDILGTAATLATAYLFPPAAPAVAAATR